MLTELLIMDETVVALLDNRVRSRRIIVPTGLLLAYDAEMGLNLFPIAAAMALRLSPQLSVDEVRLVDIADAVAYVSDTLEDVAALEAVGKWETNGTWDCDLRGDHGHSVSCWQLWVCPGALCSAALSSTREAARIALGMIKASRAACRGIGDALSLYTTGKCQHNREARQRERTAAWLTKEFGEAWREAS